MFTSKSGPVQGLPGQRSIAQSKQVLESRQSNHATMCVLGRASDPTLDITCASYFQGSLIFTGICRFPFIKKKGYVLHGGVTNTTDASFLKLQYYYIDIVIKIICLEFQSISLPL